MKCKATANRDQAYPTTGLFDDLNRRGMPNIPTLLQLTAAADKLLFAVHCPYQ